MMRDAESLLDLSRVPFTRHGNMLAITMRQDDVQGQFGSVDELYLGITAALNTAVERADLVQIELLEDGKSVPYTYKADTNLLTLRSRNGCVELCMEEKLLRFRGRGCMLRFKGYMRGHEGSCTREDGSWELCFKLLGKMLFIPGTGAMQAEGTIDWKEQHPTTPYITYGDKEGNCFEGYIAGYLSNGQIRPYYCSFDEALEESRAAFRTFREKYPAVQEEYEQTACKAAYVIWTHMTPQRGILKSDVIYMSRNGLAAAYGWQQGYQAMALTDSPEDAISVLRNMFVYQLPEGQIPDWIHSNSANFLGCKPPFQGVALDWLLDNADLRHVSYEKLYNLYQALVNWVGWWLNYRDSDHNGVPQYNNPDESGWDDASVFHMGLPVEAPDLSTYLILLMDSLSRLAKILHRDRDSADWKEKADSLFHLLMTELWDGRHFIARKSSTHETIDNASIMCYLPLLLGKRLPEQIRKELIGDLKDEKRFFFEHGIASEALDSPYAAVKSGFARGVAPAPAEMMLALAFYQCGDNDFSHELASRFVRKLARDGFAVCHFPYDSEEFMIKNSDENKAFPTDMTLDTSWSAAVFMFLAGYMMKQGKKVV